MSETVVVLGVRHAWIVYILRLKQTIARCFGETDFVCEVLFKLDCSLASRGLSDDREHRT